LPWAERNFDGEVRVGQVVSVRERFVGILFGAIVAILFKEREKQLPRPGVLSTVN